jgi:iron complex transport system substrate-binding protein
LIVRIVTLLPSATEIVCALGLADRIVGITHECDYPPEIRRLPRVVRAKIDSAALGSAEIDAQVAKALSQGESLYETDTDALRAIGPDLLITQDLCDVCALPGDDIESIVRALPGPPDVLRLHPHSLADILGDILSVGAATGRAAEARRLVAGLRARIARVEASARGRSRPRVCCLEWTDPPFCAGHWVPEMVALAGGEDVIGRAGRPSFRVEWAAIAAANPEVVVLMPCGYSVERARREGAALAGRDEWRALPATAAGRVYATDANAFFSRSGPRVVDGLEILGAVLHPDAAVWTTPPGSWAVLSALSPAEPSPEQVATARSLPRPAPGQATEAGRATRQRGWNAALRRQKGGGQ